MGYVSSLEGNFVFLLYTDIPFEWVQGTVFPDVCVGRFRVPWSHVVQEMEHRDDPVLRMELARHAKQVGWEFRTDGDFEPLCKV